MLLEENPTSFGLLLAKALSARNLIRHIRSKDVLGVKLVEKKRGSCVYDDIWEIFVTLSFFSP